MGARTVMHASVIRQMGTQYNKFVFVRATCMGHPFGTSTTDAR